MPPPHAPAARSAAPGDRLRGRGAASNPTGRFERLALAETDELRDPDAADAPPLPTHYYRDPARRIFATNDSPDLGFDTSLNPYRGCEHGCVYCYARPTHEYLGFSAGLDFETRILVKEDAAALVRAELARPRWRPRVVAIGGVTDPYQPVERRLRITRGCLAVFAEFRNPVAIVTKSALVLRDADLLAELAESGCAAVLVSVTTLDRDLARRLEPRASAPHRRLAAIEGLARAGVPVGVMMAPVIPGLTDHEIPRVLRAAADAGATTASHVMLKLPHGVKDLFAEWLERHRPERRARVLNRVREVRGGRLNDPRFHARQRGTGRYAEHVGALFDLARRRAGIRASSPALRTDAFRRPGAQLTLLEA